MAWTDQELQDYLKGKASPEAAVAVETALADDPAFERRLMALDPMAGPLADAAQLIEGPSEAQITSWTDIPAPQAQATGFAWRHMAASAVVGVALASSVWFANMRAEAPDWRAEVATYQALYSADTIASIDFDTAEINAQIADLAARVNFNELAQAVDSIDNMQVLRGQVLGFDGAPLAQIVFAAANGAPVALCVIEKSTDGQQTAIKMQNLSGLASASFETARHSWLLIGTQDDALIAQTAAQVVAQLAAL